MNKNFVRGGVIRRGGGRGVSVSTLYLILAVISLDITADDAIYWVQNPDEACTYKYRKKSMILLYNCLPFICDNFILHFAIVY